MRRSIEATSDPARPLTADELVNWYVTGRRGRASPMRAKGPFPGDRFSRWLEPLGNPYFSPLNPVFLSGVRSLKTLNERPVWLARDGAIPLLWFFRSFPDPAGVRATLFVHEDLAALVPAPWRGRIGTYRARTRVRQTAPSRLVLLAPFSDSLTPLDALEARLRRLKRKKGKSEILLLSWLKPDAFGNPVRAEYHSQALISVCRELGAGIRAITWEELERMTDLQGAAVASLGGESVCVDSFVLHLALSRGASWIDLSASTLARRSRRTAGTFVELSPFHGMELVFPPGSQKSLSALSSEKGAMAERYLKKLQPSSATGATSLVPWPQWFHAWAQTVLGAGSVS